MKIREKLVLVEGHDEFYSELMRMVMAMEMEMEGGKQKGQPQNKLVKFRETNRNVKENKFR